MRKIPKARHEQAELYCRADDDADLLDGPTDRPSVFFCHDAFLPLVRLHTRWSDLYDTAGSPASEGWNSGPAAHRDQAAPNGVAGAAAPAQAASRCRNSLTVPSAK